MKGSTIDETKLNELVDALATSEAEYRRLQSEAREARMREERARNESQAARVSLEGFIYEQIEARLAKRAAEPKP